MKEKWAAWPFYRQAMLVATVGVMVLFTVFNLTVGSQQGVDYGDFYAMTTVGETKRYTANAHIWREGNASIHSNEGRKTVYAVTPTDAGGFRVECRMGEETFGPYQVEPLPLADLSTRVLAFFPDGGMEITNLATGELLFRGGYSRSSAGYAFLLDENKEGEAGSILDYAPPRPEKGPGCDDLYHFTFGAEESMTRRADWLYFFCALLFAAFNAVSLLYAEELFTFRMSFLVADPKGVEPSEWELLGRRAGWVLFLAVEVVLFFAGLFSGT